MQSLQLWSRVLTASVRSTAPDLTARQMALLLIVYLNKKPKMVRDLAVMLNISKPAVSRAIDRLCILGFVLRRRDDRDGRNVFVERTDAGAAFLTTFGQIIDAAQN